MGSKIGLALSGGGARGFAHIGVLTALAENDVPIDMVAGTSVGAFVGGAFAAGLTPDEIYEIGRSVSWTSVAGFSYSARGLLSNAAMAGFIQKHFPLTRIEELPVPFAAVACDLETGEEVVFRDSGDLATAIRASCAIPGVFVPVEDENGRVLVDGGVTSPMPTKAVRKLGAEKVIAVDLITAGGFSGGVPTTLIGTFVQSAVLMLRIASKSQHYRADIVIEPKIAHIRPDEIGKRDELFNLGYEAATEKLDLIKALFDSEGA